MATEYIKRQAALNIVCHDDCEDCPDGGCDMYRRLKRLPAADVRPVVHGKWEGETDFIYADLSQRVICGKCGAFAYFYDKMPMNFCPNCGCQMKGERK